MKKVVLIFFLLIIITISSGYSFLKISANGGEDSYFNANLREDFAKIPLARKALGLHYDGDAKGDYLGNNYEEVEIAVSLMENNYINDKIFIGLSEKIENITGKKTNYRHIKIDDFEENSTLEGLREKLRKMRYSSNKAVVYLFVVNGLENEKEQIGSTLMEDGLVYFQNTTMLNANKEDSESFDEDFIKYSISTLLHEFGHQIGLDHNEEKGCLMNPKTEFTNMRNRKVIDDFCDSEKEKILKIKSLYQQ